MSDNVQIAVRSVPVDQRASLSRAEFLPALLRLQRDDSKLAMAIYYLASHAEDPRGEENRTRLREWKGTTVKSTFLNENMPLFSTSSLQQAEYLSGI